MSSNDQPRRVQRVLRKDRPKSRDNDVGYGKPPKAHQFKPGQSGNPKGRPKGAKSQKTIFLEVANRKVTLRQDGKTRTITCQEGVIHRVAEKSLQGDIKSATLFLSQLAAIESTPGKELEMGPDDKAVLDAYVKQLQSKPSGDKS